MDGSVDKLIALKAQRVEFDSRTIFKKIPHKLINLRVEDSMVGKHR